MTTSQRQLKDVIDSHAERVTQIMKHCEIHSIKFNHYEPLKYAIIKMHGLIDAAKALEINTSHYRWAYAVLPEVVNFFVVPVNERDGQQRTRTQTRNKQKEYSAKPV
jgi:hypothetical protein